MDEIYGSDMPIWFSEIGALPSTDPQVQSDFIEGILEKLDGEGRVQRYAYFMASYLTNGNSLAEGGQKYASPAT